MKDIQENCLNRKLRNENKNVNNTDNEKTEKMRKFSFRKK